MSVCVCVRNSRGVITQHRSGAHLDAVYLVGLHDVHRVLQVRVLQLCRVLVVVLVQTVRMARLLLLVVVVVLGQERRLRKDQRRRLLHRRPL